MLADVKLKIIYIELPDYQSVFIAESDKNDLGTFVIP